MRLIALAIAGALMLTGCAELTELRQKDRYESWVQSAQWQKIADEPVVKECADNREPCGRLHALRADACHELAMSVRAPGAACPPSSAKAQLVCAADEYKKAAATPDTGLPPDKLVKLRLPRAQALHCLAEIEAPQGVAFAREARALLPAPDTDQETAVVAQAELHIAVHGPADQRCAPAGQALALARGRLPLVTDPSSREALERVAADAKLVLGKSKCGG